MRKSYLKALVFAGTTEGRRACDYLASFGAAVEAFVATSYGAAIYKDNPLIRVREGRLNADEMEEIFVRELACGDIIVVDATHPHAVEVSANIKKACNAAGAELFRILRPYSRPSGGTVVENAAEAAAYLAEREGAVLITSGTRDLNIYASIIKDKKRLYVRVLPDPGILAYCLELGIEASGIVCMQGPFSKEMNAATLKSCGASFMVTKDSGPAGGMEEKLDAAAEANVEVVIIKRPDEKGYSFEEFGEKISERLDRKTNNKKKEPVAAVINPFGTDESSAEKSLLQEYETRTVASASIEDLYENGDIISCGEYVPLFLKASGEKALVVGGGKVGSRRAEKLFSFGMDVTVISPSVKGGAADLAAKGKIKWIKRKATASDVSSSYKIIACCAGDPELADAMGAKASQLGILFNSAEDKDKCDFFFPAVVGAKSILAAVISREGADHMRAVGAATFLRNKLYEYDEKY